MSKLCKLEQETIILFSNGEDEAEVYTHYRPYKRKLNSLCESHPNLFRLIRDNGDGGLTFMVPKQYIKINAPRAKKQDKDSVSVQAVFEDSLSLD